MYLHLATIIGYYKPGRLSSKKCGRQAEEVDRQGLGKLHPQMGEGRGGSPFDFAQGRPFGEPPLQINAHLGHCRKLIPVFYPFTR